MFEHEGRFVAAHFKHAARAVAPRGGMPEARIEEARVMDAEFADHRQVGRHFGGVVRWNGHGFAADENVERPGVQDDAALVGMQFLPEFAGGIVGDLGKVNDARMRLGAIPDQRVVAGSEVDREAEAVVEEIVPYADPQSRTFLVKSGLPAMPGLYPGMFGKLRVPAETHEVVTIPAAALRKVGQLELVTVKVNGQWVTRYIKAGRSFDGRIEVLSGLDGGETVGVY